MQINVPSQMRNPWYDRSPNVGGIDYNGELVSPHGETSRGSYTVGSGLKAYINAIAGQAVRTGTASPYDHAYVVVKVTPSGGAAKIVFRLMLENNTPGDTVSLSMSPNMVLDDGDKVEIFTSDASTGGSISYAASLVYTEFTA